MIKKSSYQIETLKYIAIITMFLDHFSKIVYQVSFFDILGRITFPLFMFILIYNYLNNTKDKYTYIKRLVILALISQPIYILVFETFRLNILFTLSFSLIVIYIYEKYFCITKFISLIYIVIIILFSGMVIEYSYFSFFLAISFYIYIKKKSIYSNIGISLSILLQNIVYSIKLGISGLLVLPLIHMSPSFIKKRTNKYIFYIFYPAHLLFLYIL